MGGGEEEEEEEGNIPWLTTPPVHGTMAQTGRKPPTWQRLCKRDIGMYEFWLIDQQGNRLLFTAVDPGQQAKQ